MDHPQRAVVRRRGSATPRGTHAPGRRDVGLAAAATHHLLLAHGRAVQAIRAAVARGPGRHRPQPPADARGERPPGRPSPPPGASDGNLNRLFLDPVLRGEYPADMLAHYAAHRPGFDVVQDGDLAVIAQPLDFLGVNFYAPADGLRGQPDGRGPGGRVLGAGDPPGATR